MNMSAIHEAEPEVLRFTLLSKNVLTADEQELYELAQLAGVILDPNVFKIILDLIKMNVAPQAVLQMLKSMCGGRRKKPVSAERGGAPPREGEVDPRRVRSGSQGRIHNISGKTETRR